MRYGADRDRVRRLAKWLGVAVLTLAGCGPVAEGMAVSATPAAVVPLATAATVMPSSSPTPPAVPTLRPTETSIPCPTLTVAPQASATHAPTLPPTPTSTTPAATHPPPAPTAAAASVAPTTAPQTATPPPPTPVIPTAVPPAPGAVAALATSASGPLAVPAGVLRLSGRERALYAAAIARGRDGAMFTIAGDSNSEWSGYLGQVATGAYDLRLRPAFAPAASRFGPSFRRHSVATAGGLRAADMFLTDWPDKPAACARDEGRYTCELRLSGASIVFIQLGTGDRFVWTEYEGHIRHMLDVALQLGVLPVLVTKADDLESWQGGAPIDHMNTVIRRLAAEYQVPMIDFYVATRNLPVIPNPQLPDRPFTKNGLLDEWGYYFHLSDLGKEMRIATTLAMLAAISN